MILKRGDGMKGIKFRVWDKEKKQMMYQSLAGLEDLYISLLDGKVYQRGFHTGEMFAAGDENGFELMQFTGLHDRDGREIYEWDIISIHQFLFDGSEFENELTGAIVFCEKEAAFHISRIKNKMYQDCTGYAASEGSEPICSFVGLHEESFKVIGNRFENRELLGE
jgi:uncharacterized phage protein (TIGR01671 family)